MLALRLALGTSAVLLSLGVAQLASGQDLSGALQALASAGQDVNRDAKADRAPRRTVDGSASHTVSFNLDGVSATSVAVRIPQRREPEPVEQVQETPAVKSPVRPMVACEATVSVLTDIARRLQPGRCVT